MIESTENLEQELASVNSERSQVEKQRKRETAGTLDNQIEERFKALQTKILELAQVVETSKNTPLLVNIHDLTEALKEIAGNYDEAIRDLLIQVTEYYKAQHAQEIGNLQKRFEVLSDSSSDVLRALRDVLVKLDKFTSNLELEREVLLDVKAELKR